MTNGEETIVTEKRNALASDRRFDSKGAAAAKAVGAAQERSGESKDSALPSGEIANGPPAPIDAVCPGR